MIGLEYDIKMTGIYKITSPSGNIYIGQSVDLADRFRRYKKLKCKLQPFIYRSLLKHGSDKHLFEIIHELPKDVSQTILNDYEIFYINIYKEAGVVLMNIKSGGAGGGKCAEETKKKIGDANRGRKMSEHQRLSISSRQKGKPAWNKGMKGRKLNLTVEKRKARSEIAKKRIGFKHSEETKLQFSLTRKGRQAYNKGKKCSEDHKRKLSIAHTGKKLSEATKAKLSEINKGRPATNNKLSICQVREIKTLLFEGNLSQYRIAKNYGVNKVTIFDIKHGKSWKNG